MIGDVLNSTFLCESLKEHLPDAEIHYMAHSHTLTVIEGNPYIDEIIDFVPKHRKDRLSFLRLLRDIRRRRYDAVIDIYGKLESILITGYSAAPLRIGYKKPHTPLFYTHLIPRVKVSPTGNPLIMEHRASLLGPLLPQVPIDALIKRPRIFLSEAQLQEGTDLLSSKGVSAQLPMILIGAMGSDPTKTYPLPYMARVIDTIADNTRATLVFNYTPSQKEKALQLYERCGNKAKASIAFGATPTSLQELLGVLYHCTAVIGNEGGVVNMAKALGIPTFSIFSPWIPKEDWLLFPDKRNVGVHLSDHEPDRIYGHDKKQLKASVHKLYHRLTPEKFHIDLKQFLKEVDDQ